MGTLNTNRLALGVCAIAIGAIVLLKTGSRPSPAPVPAISARKLEKQDTQKIQSLTQAMAVSLQKKGNAKSPKVAVAISLPKVQAPRIPSTNEKHDGRLIRIGDAAHPRVRGVDGVPRLLSPLGATRKEIARVLQAHQGETLEDKLRNPKYREKLFNRAKSARGAFLLPRPGYLPELFSRILGISEAFAANGLDQGSLLDILTPIKDQGSDRFTCQTFAALAGIETAYLRDYGLTLDLSEQFSAHIGKSTFLDNPRIFDYEAQSSLWGGGNTLASTELAEFYSLPLEFRAPYTSYAQQVALRDRILGPKEGAKLNQPETASQSLIDAFEYDDRYIPNAARYNAPYRVGKYVPAGPDIFKNTQDIESLIDARIPIAMDIELRWRWNQPLQTYEWEPAEAPGGSYGVHSMLLVGYRRHPSNDNRLSVFMFKNSWGGNDLVLATYEFVQKSAQGGAIIESVLDPNLGTPNTTKWLGRWFLSWDGLSGNGVNTAAVLTVRRMAKDGTGFRLGSLTNPILPGSKIVTGQAMSDGTSVQFSTSDNKNAPTTVDSSMINGKLDLLGAEATAASGYLFQGRNYNGLYMQRSRIGALVVNENLPTANGWLGNWRLNVDGITGILHLTAIGQSGEVSGTYSLQGAGPQKVFLGKLIPGKVNQLNLPLFGGIRLVRMTLNPSAATGFSLPTRTGGREKGVYAELLEKGYPNPQLSGR